MLFGRSQFMVLHTLQYTCDFYMDFVLSNKNVRHLLLPAMFPLVLYNGDDAWTAPDTLETLIEQGVQLGDDGLHFKHLVIAENEFDKEAVLRIRRLVQWRFSLAAEEQAHYAAHLERIDNLGHLLHLIDQLLAQPTLATFAEALRGYLPPTDQ